MITLFFKDDSLIFNDFYCCWFFSSLWYNFRSAL